MQAANTKLKADIDAFATDCGQLDASESLQKSAAPDAVRGFLKARPQWHASDINTVREAIRGFIYRAEHTLRLESLGRWAYSELALSPARDVEPRPRSWKHCIRHLGCTPGKSASVAVQLSECGLAYRVCVETVDRNAVFFVTDTPWRTGVASLGQGDLIALLPQNLASIEVATALSKEGAPLNRHTAKVSHKSIDIAAARKNAPGVHLRPFRFGDMTFWLPVRVRESKPLRNSRFPLQSRQMSL